MALAPVSANIYSSYGDTFKPKKVERNVSDIQIEYSDNRDTQGRVRPMEYFVTRANQGMLAKEIAKETTSSQQYVTDVQSGETSVRLSPEAAKFTFFQQAEAFNVKRRPNAETIVVSFCGGLIDIPMIDPLQAA